MRVMNVRRSFRRSIAVSAVVASAILGGQIVGVFTGEAGGAASSVPLGTASATAQTYKVNPQAGALSLGIAFGETLTNYQNKVAIAEARGIDLGIIGSLLAAEGCDGGDPTLPADQQPQPVHVEARNDQHDQSASGTDEGVFAKNAHATDQPLADSVVTTAPFGAPGIFEIGAGRAESISRYNDDGSREAIATVDIGSLKFGVASAPAASITGLHWEVRRVTGARDETVQKFTFGSLVIGGSPVPTADITDALRQLNGALSNIGIELTPPESRSGAGFIYVDPMKIGVVPNATRDQIAGTLLGALQPVRQPLVDALIKQDCGNATYITVGDVVLGSVSGAGAFEVELGGVHATSGEFSEFRFPGLPALPSLPEVAPFVDTAPAVAPVALPVQNGAAAPSVLRTPRQLQRAADVKGSRGGKLALAAAIGLGLIVLTVELDRRKMRHAQRVAEAAATTGE
jgi:hypothetical protein